MTHRGFNLAVLSLGFSLCPLTAYSQAMPQGKAPSNSHFLQYGVSFVAENVAWAADICPTTNNSNNYVPCILGSGFGATVRVGYRSRSPWYFGGAYEFSHHDSSNLLRLAILQQIRAEGRY